MPTQRLSVRRSVVRSSATTSSVRLRAKTLHRGLVVRLPLSIVCVPVWRFLHGRKLWSSLREMSGWWSWGVSLVTSGGGHGGTEVFEVHF